MNKNISKILISLISILFLAARSLTAYADIIYEPNDSFYHDNNEKMKHLGREYRANGADGNITVYNKPPSMKKVATFENGTVFYVSYTYTSILGTIWGVIEYSNDTDSNVIDYSNRESGWVKMADMELVYDDISFYEEHKDQLNSYNNEFNIIKEKEGLLLWTYPGSGSIKSDFNIISDFLPEFSYTYTDENDRVWGYINYYMGLDGWFCFSAPTDESLPKIVVESNNLNSTSQGYNNKLTSNHTQNEKIIVMIAIILVSSLVIITILLIRKFMPKNQGVSKK